MLTEEQVKALIVIRTLATNSSCNTDHVGHVKGQLRALVAVLTGQRPPLLESWAHALDLAQVPYQDLGNDRFGLCDDWLLAHGFVITKGETPEQDVLRHPDFPPW